MQSSQTAANQTANNQGETRWRARAFGQPCHTLQQVLTTVCLSHFLLRTMFKLLFLTSLLGSTIAGGLRVQRPQLLSTIDFEQYAAGDVVSDLGGGVTVTAKKMKKFGLAPGLAMVFDSACPTGDDTDLGTPNESFGGPGIGADGQSGRPFENSIPLGKVLIISENGDSAEPDDNRRGGLLSFSFGTPTFVDSIGLLDNEDSVSIRVHTAGGNALTILERVGGDNSFNLVPVQISGVIKLDVMLNGSGAVSHVTLSPKEPECESSIDFASYMTGQVITGLEDGVAPGVSVQARKGKEGGDFGPAEAVIENVDPQQGNVLVISEDEGSLEYGGLFRFRFEEPTAVNSIGLFDNVGETFFRVTTDEGEKRVIIVKTDGDHDVQIWVPNAIMVVVEFKGTGALTGIDLSTPCL
jgi:hypothetical protein